MHSKSFGEIWGWVDCTICVHDLWPHLSTCKYFIKTVSVIQSSFFIQSPHSDICSHVIYHCSIWPSPQLVAVDDSSFIDAHWSSGNDVESGCTLHFAHLALHSSSQQLQHQNPREPCGVDRAASGLRASCPFPFVHLSRIENLSFVGLQWCVSVRNVYWRAHSLPSESCPPTSVSETRVNPY